MPEIKDILSQYPEDILQNIIKGKLINGKVEWKNKPICVQVEKLESNQILFKHNNQPIRISYKQDLSNENLLGIDSPGYFRQIVWIDWMKDDELLIKYLFCGNGQIFNSDLDIGFGDNIILSNKNVKIEKWSENLKNDFVFKSDSGEMIFIQTYPGSAENFTIHGLKKRVDIRKVEDKWIVQKIVNKPFPKKHNDFLLLNVAQYPSVSFVESSKAKEAYETIKAEEAKGNTLIGLWRIYSSIELERSQILKEKVGDLKFLKVKNLPEGITRIKLQDLNDDLKSAISENIDDISNTSFEIKPAEEKEQSAKSNSPRFNIKSINRDYTIDLYDDINIIPESGVFNISMLGDEIVNKRRERALKSLREDRRFITRNLLFAIEGVADAMLVKKRNEKAITDRTRKFLKSKFGIDDLTANQKAAVEIAINSPDLAIIQGPPGTGKSTVVAAICDRLIEIAEKEKNQNNSKLILVSAFQNDTVEHIASKIFTLGLPTIKIGKETQSNIRAEDKLIEEIKLKIDFALQSISKLSNSNRISKQLKDILAIYLNENNELDAKSKINDFIKTIELSDELWEKWNDLTNDLKFNSDSGEKNLTALRGLRTEKESYNDDGFYKVQKLLKTDIQFSIEELDKLNSCPIDNPSEDYLNLIKTIKEKYMEEINGSISKIASGNNIGLASWIEDAISYFKKREETSYEDENTFIASNLETIRAEIDGNSAYLRDSIKEYGESLAATNQVAGSREMSTYNNIENVILEEAARSNPLDLLIPMAKATERIIMVGDQNQLPHLLEDDIADETSVTLKDKFQVADTRKKLEESLFGVIFKNLSLATPQRTITLTEQFRMHPFIGDFISKTYYREELKAGMPNQSELKQHGLNLNWAKNKVAIFCDVKNSIGAEQRSQTSKIRPVEAKRIVQLLDEIKNDPNSKNLTVGIITFYSKQVLEIYAEATRKGYAEQKADGSYEISKQYKETADGREMLRIGSVDSFQGKEFDIVILSTVRSNVIERTHDNYKKVFGFLTLENRLNVAFSRAQKMLIVVGDGNMFSDDYAKTYVEGLFEFYTQLTTHAEYGNRI